MGDSALCFRCHSTNYRTGTGNTDSGFFDVGTGKDDLHDYHVNKIGSLRCNWCHVALPHGWKNKQFLVNLADVGPECAGHSVGDNVTIPSKNNGFNCAPYYQDAFLRISSWAVSGQWQDTNCGGKNFMTNTCDSPN